MHYLRDKPQPECVRAFIDLGLPLVDSVTCLYDYFGYRVLKIQTHISKTRRVLVNFAPGPLSLPWKILKLMLTGDLAAVGAEYIFYYEGGVGRSLMIFATAQGKSTQVSAYDR